MYTEDEYLMLSALQHLLFCERQCCLIHCEQVWAENYFTVSGDIFHEKAHSESSEKCGPDKKIDRGLMIKSAVLGIAGKADIVEFHRQTDNIWLPFPVEYKHGKPKLDRCDEVQLCTQALCLEEMLHVKIPSGALFYGRTMHRTEVIFSEELRDTARKTCARLHELFSSGVTPPPVYNSKKCDSCSLYDYCLPKSVSSNKPASKYLKSAMDSL